MEFKKLIETRRSVRAYASAASKEDIEAILTMAQMAPSWKNGQPVRCYAVVTPEKVQEVQEKALPVFNANSSKNASLIVTTYVKGISGWGAEGQQANEIGNGWGAYDLGLHDAYLVLAASEMGYDTLIMGIREADALRDILGIPEDDVVMSVIAVGKRAQEPNLRPRKSLEEVTKFF